MCAVKSCVQQNFLLLHSCISASVIFHGLINSYKTGLIFGCSARSLFVLKRYKSEKGSLERLCIKREKWIYKLLFKKKEKFFFRKYTLIV